MPWSPDKPLRRAISVAAFPQPPRSGSRPSTAVSVSGPQGIKSSGSVKVKRGSRLSAGTTSSYRSSKSSSILNGNIDGKSILSADPEGSPSQSRSSSAQGSYSTSATTFEDTEDATIVSKTGLKRKEAKGNVIVSVRVRPDAGEAPRPGGEYMVDGRRALISYGGKEGGDYYYGKK